jgi:hypothetical protein
MKQIVIVTALLQVTSLAHAEEDPIPVTPKVASFHLGVRIGYSLPLGNTNDSTTSAGLVKTSLSEAVSGGIPVILDLGYRLTPRVMLGVYGQYGYVFVKEGDAGCPSGGECSGADYRFGVQGRYDLSPEKTLRPWFGLGLGYEILTGKGTYSGFEFSRSFWGFEFLNLQGGVDFALGESLAIGPFAQFSVGQFSNTKTPLGSDSQDITGTHGWLTLGVAGSAEF